MAALAELVRVALAAPGRGGGAAASAHSLVAALHGSGLLAGRVVEVGLDRRRRTIHACSDLDDRQTLDLAEVVRKGDGATTLGHTIVRR
jgi:hypothetical protein